MLIASTMPQIAPKKAALKLDPTILLDIRVPTTTKNFSAEKREEIMAKAKPGDIFLSTNDAYPHWQQLEFLTMGASYTHASMYEGNGQILEATTGDPSGAGVIRTPIEEFLQGPIKVAVVRPNYESSSDVDEALGFARDQLGKPYDGAFNFADNSEFSCTELVSKALHSMEHPQEVKVHKVFGREAVAPDDFKELPGATIIHDDGSYMPTNMLSHWPVGLSGAVGGVAAGLAASQLIGGAAATVGGGVVGLVAGLTMGVLVGNQMQTGNFNLYGG